MKQDHQYQEIDQSLEQIRQKSSSTTSGYLQNLDIESNAQPTLEIVKRERRQNKYLWKMIGLGLLLHVLFLFSIFDVYIQSWRPLGMTPVEPFNKKPLAKRLMLFQYDGGRSDIIYGLQSESDEPEIGKPRVPLIHNRIKEGKASFGIQYAAVPTESRVCVQNMMGGYQEDMTAILSGWASHHGLEYDRIYNHVKAGFFFGPSIISSIFESQNCPSCVRVDYFLDSEINYYDHEQASTFDKLNYDKIKRLFNGTLVEDRKNKTLYDKEPGDKEKLAEDKLMVYMNWVSCDAIGTGFKPTNKEYRKSIRTAAKYIEEIEEDINKYYGNDGETAFILLADHGIADIGAHGDGNPQNTWTPFVLWGKGIKPADDEQDPKNPETHDDFSKKWGLTMKKRFDIDQSQLPSLISSILGLPIPMNNEGVLPLKLLDATEVYKANILLQNAYQLQTTYSKIQELVQERQKWFFTEYEHSPKKILNFLSELKKQVDQIASKSEDGKSATKEQNEELNRIISDTYVEIQNIRSGISYLKLYQKTLLQIAVALGYVSFMLLCFAVVFRYINTNQDKENRIVQQNTVPFVKNFSLIITLCFTAFILLYLNVTQSKPVYYAYFGFPIFFSYQFYKHRHFMNEGWGQNILKLICSYALIGLAGQCLMYSFFEREFISYNFLAISVFSLIHSKYSFGQITGPVLRWSLACILISIFPLLPPIQGVSDINYIFGFICITITTFYISFYHFKHELETSVKAMTISILYCGGISLYLRTVASSTVPYYIFAINWIILFSLVGSIVFLNLHKNSDPQLRLYSLIVIMINLQLLFGISYDTLFILIFSFLLKTWVDHEKEVSVLIQNKQILPYHFYTAFKFILIMNISFFGIQDLVSLGSFNYESITRFLVNLQEILTLVLMLFKLSFPFLCGASAFIVVCKLAYKQLSTIGLFMLSIIFAEIMTINFFFMIRTEGTWQEKGSSVARFVISSLLTLLYVSLFFIAHILFKNTKFDEKQKN
ncbi:hypothetical protein ABPG72_002300 [Tetrahymena utriculariae]